MLIRKDILLTAIMTLLAIQGCTEDEMTGGNTRWCEVEASFEETLTRVGLSTMENSRNLVAKWQEGDQINVILCANDKYYEVGPVPVREISNDGRSCKFSYRLPENFKEPSDGYQLMCFTSNCQPKIIDNEVYYNGSLIRRPISQFKASVMSDEHASSGMFQSNFRHYYTYELLHISNKSDKDIDFALCAYSADLIWYRTLCAVRNWDGRAIYPSEAAQAAIEESPTVKIPANGSDIIVSAYIPNGQLIKNAQMTAKINGEYVYTSNLLSSDKELERGHAYHMYATWDGKELKFDKGGDSPQDYPVADIIDLGLPSGTRWASFDMGATKSGEFGSEYAWGETEVKEKYTEENYLYSGKNLGSCISGTEYDVAHVNWGDNWQMPTKAQFEELINKCSIETVEEYGIKGMKFTGPNGSSIFFPFEEGRLGSYSTYWSGTADEGSAYNLFVDDDGTASLLGGSSRYFGRFVRPVEISKMVPPVLTITPEDGKINFGVVMQDTEKTETLSVKNTSTNVVTIYLDADKGFENTIEVSDNMEEITLSPGASKDYSITAHGLPAGYSASTNVFVRMVGSDEVTKVNLTFIGNDYSPLVSETTMTLAVGEKGSVRVKPSNVKIELDVDGIVEGIGGGPGEGVHLDEEHESVIYSQSFGLTFTALKAGVVHVTFSDSYTEQIEVLTITVTDGPSYPVAEAIDLGLPSGTKWASWNVGASKPEEYGGYYAWGETEEKEVYDWSTYTHCDGSAWTCHHIGDDIAGTQYDVAHVKWGGSWRMPTSAQQDELRENCTRTWTQQNGVIGTLVTGPNGNTIFLPAAGHRLGGDLYFEGGDGSFWSSSLPLGGEYEFDALFLGFGSYYWNRYGYYRYGGFSVRAVCP